MEQLEVIMGKLAVPFPADSIYWKAEEIGEDIARAFPYADLRAYEDRLNTVAGGWKSQATFLVAGGRLVCTVSLSISDVTRMGDGEAFLKDSNATTAAYAQAFKRACSRFGLGRWLYDLPTPQVVYDPEGGQFPPESVRGLREAYARWLAGDQDAWQHAFGGLETHPGPVPRPATQPSPEPVVEERAGLAPGEGGTDGNGPDLEGLRARARAYKIDFGRFDGHILGDLVDAGEMTYLKWLAGLADFGGKKHEPTSEQGRKLMAAAKWLITQALAQPASTPSG